MKTCNSCMYQQRWRLGSTKNIIYRCGVVLEDGTMNREAPTRKYAKACEHYVLNKNNKKQ